MKLNFFLFVLMLQLVSVNAVIFRPRETPSAKTERIINKVMSGTKTISKSEDNYLQKRADQLKEQTGFTADWKDIDKINETLEALERRIKDNEAMQIQRASNNPAEYWKYKKIIETDKAQLKLYEEMLNINKTLNSSEKTDRLLRKSKTQSLSLEDFNYLKDRLETIKKEFFNYQQRALDKNNIDMEINLLKNDIATVESGIKGLKEVDPHNLLRTNVEKLKKLQNLVNSLQEFKEINLNIESIKVVKAEKVTGSVDLPGPELQFEEATTSQSTQPIAQLKKTVSQPSVQTISKLKNVGEAIKYLDQEISKLELTRETVGLSSIAGDVPTKQEINESLESIQRAIDSLEQSLNNKTLSEKDYDFQKNRLLKIKQIVTNVLPFAQ